MHNLCLFMKDEGPEYSVHTQPLMHPEHNLRLGEAFSHTLSDIILILKVSKLTPRNEK